MEVPAFYPDELLSTTDNRNVSPDKVCWRLVCKEANSQTNKAREHEVRKVSLAWHKENNRQSTAVLYRGHITAVCMQRKKYGK